MFRVQILENRSAIRLKVAGTFVRNFVDEAQQFVASRKAPEKVTVDISEISFVDFYGEKALNWMRLMGARFIAESPYSLRICKRLHLPVVSKALSPDLAGVQSF